MSRFVFTLTQDGMEVARVESDDEARAVREIMHYAMMYGQDGPCTVSGPGICDAVSALLPDAAP